MGKTRKNQPGYVPGKDKNGRTTWKPDGSQTPHAGGTSGTPQSATNDFSAPQTREERKFDNDASMFEEAKSITSYEELDEFLHHSHPHARTAALHVRDNELKMYALGELMDDPDEEVRMAVAGNGAVSLDVIKSFRTDTSDAVRVVAAERSVGKDAEYFFADDNEFVREASLRHNSSKEIIEKSVSDPSPVVRAKAAKLGFGNEKLLHDPDAEVQENAEKYKKERIDYRHPYGHSDNYDSSDLKKKNELVNGIRGISFSAQELENLVDTHPDEDVQFEAFKRIASYDYISKNIDSQNTKIRDFARSTMKNLSDT